MRYAQLITAIDPKVELDHGQVVGMKSLDWTRIKPLIWW